MEILLAMIGVVVIAALSDWFDLRRGKRMKQTLEDMRRAVHGDDDQMPPK
jgi:hypothetical protein